MLGRWISSCLVLRSQSSFSEDPKQVGVAKNFGHYHSRLCYQWRAEMLLLLLSEIMGYAWIT